jgi:hypothetical protein
MQKFKKVVLRLLLAIAIFIGLAIGMAYLFEEDVKQYAVKTVNTYIKSEIKVEGIEFSFIKKFPSASLEFKNVLAFGTSEATKKDTLFQFGSIFMEFNIWNIINKNYTVNKLSFEKGAVHLSVDENGEENYIFWKESDSVNTDKTDLNLSLESVHFEQVGFSYINEPKQIQFSNYIHQLELEGAFTNTKYDLNFETNFQLYTYQQGGNIYAENRAVELKSVFKIDREASTYTIKNAALNFAKLPFTINGFLKNLDDGMLIDLSIASENVSIPAIIELLPETQKSTLKTYQIDGNVLFDGLIKGEITSVKSPSVNFNFQVEKGSFIHQESDVALNNISLNGSYDNGNENALRTSKISLENINAKFGKGSINGGLTLTDFNDPSYAFNGNLTLFLEELIPFMNVTSITDVSGQLDIHIETKGRIAKLKEFTLADWKQAQTKGEVTLQAVNFRLKNKPQEYKNISGGLIIRNNDIKANNLKGSISRSDFNFNGTLHNLIGYLFSEDQPLKMDASLRSKRIFLDELLLSDKSTPSDSAYQLTFSDRISFYLDCKIDSLSFSKFSFSSAQAFVSLQNKILKASGVSFKTMQGDATGYLVVNTTTKGKVIISSEAQLKNISITDLFNDFGNFGQQTITAQNLKGIANCDIEFYSELTPQLVFDKKTLEVQADLNIEKGELINFASLEALSDYIALSELKHIKFSTLSNQIIIKDERIFIPSFDINSSALNLKLEGSHSFDNDINYKIQLLLNDIMGNKAKAARKKQSEFGQIEDDGLGKTRLFIKMTGNLSDPKISYDTDALKLYWKEGLKSEKKVVKSMLKEEFGLFKKDTTLKSTPDRSTKKQTFELEWDEGENQTPQKDVKETETEKKKTKKSGIGKFIDKIAQPNENEFEE